MIDVLIIGTGPAGISAALYTRRAGFGTTVIGLGVGALEKADKIENYYGLVEPLSGSELADIGINQAKKLGAVISREEVLDIRWDGDFSVSTTENTYTAKTVILTTGTSRKKLRAKNLEEFEGKGISYCAVCDAFFYRQKAVGVIGDGDYALHEVNELLPIASSVTLFTNGKPPQVDVPDTVKVIDTPIASFFGDGVLKGIELSDGEKVYLDGVFIAVGTAAASDLAKKLGVETNGNNIVVDETMATNIPGMFAAGDCIGGHLQASVAVGEGAKAGLSAIAYIRKNKK